MSINYETHVINSTPFKITNDFDNAKSHLLVIPLATATINLPGSGRFNSSLLAFKFWPIEHTYACGARRGDPAAAAQLQRRARKVLFAPDADESEYLNSESFQKLLSGLADLLR